MANRYWVGGSGTSWNTAANWASTSGGAGGAGVPTSSDVVYFDSNSNANPTCDVGNADVYSLITTGFNGTINLSGDFDVWGNPGVITLSSTTTIYADPSQNYRLRIQDTASITITQNSATLDCNFTTDYGALDTSAIVNVNGNLILGPEYAFDPTSATFTLNNSNSYVSAGFLNIGLYIRLYLNTNGKLISTAQANNQYQSGLQPVYIDWDLIYDISGSNLQIEVTAPQTGYTKLVETNPDRFGPPTAIVRNLGLKVSVTNGGFSGGTIRFQGYFGDLTLGNVSYTVTKGTYNFAVYGDLVISGTSPTISAGISLLTQSGQTNRSKTINTNNCVLGDISFSNADASIDTYTVSTNFKSTGTVTFNSFSNLSLSSIDFECASFVSSTTSVRTIALNDSILNITGASWNCATSTNLTVTYGAAARINMTSGSSKTFAGGGKTWPTVNQGGAGALTVTGNNTFTSFVNTVTGCTISFPSGTTTFSNFGIKGAFGSPVTLSNTSTLSKASGVVASNYLNLSNSTATGGAQWYAGSASTDGGGNSGWIFSTASTGGFLAFF